MPSMCAGVFSSSSASWYEYGQAPGSPSFVSTPSTAVTSAYANFAVNTTAPLELVDFQYSLDAAPWSGCGTTLKVGPLAPGQHTVAVRATSGVHPSMLVSDSVVFQWDVISASNSTIELSGLADGQHSLVVQASDVIGHVEAHPRTYTWTVDTIRPGTSVALLSPPLTSSPVGTLSVACTGEAYPSLCMFCWWTVVGSTTLPQSCASNTTISASTPGDGAVTAFVTAVDAAGNVGAAVSVSWRQDTTPPVTNATILSPRIYVPLLHASAVNTSFITLGVQASEAVQGWCHLQSCTSVSIIALALTVHLPGVLLCWMQATS